MKKNLLILLSLLIGWSALNAQLADGTVLTQNITGTDIITQENVDLFAILDSGKSVVVDAYATWCAPCWNIHQNGILKDMHELYGPNGTDQIRVIGAEVDGSTPESDIYGGGTSVGDWTEGVDYHMLNDAAWGTYFQIAYYPSIFVIRPDRTVIHMYGDDLRQFIVDRDFFATALGVSGQENSVLLLGEVETSANCYQVNYNERLDFINMGTSAVTSATADLIFNGEVQETIEYEGNLGVFQTGFIQSGLFFVDETTDIELKLTSVNNEAVTDSEANTKRGTILFPLVQERTFIINVTTDFYPGETSGTVASDDGTLLLEFGPFMPGNADQFGGGGPDANTTHSFEVTIPEDIDPACLRIIVNDAFDDGLIYFNSQTHPFPGVSVEDLEGNVIKPIIESPDFGASITMQVGADVATDNNELPSITGVQLSPVPVYDNLTIRFNTSIESAHTVNLIDITGRVLMTYNVDTSAGFNSTTMNVADIPSGMYMVTIQNKQGTISESVIKN